LSNNARVRAVPAWTWLALIVAASTTFRALLTRNLPGPFIFVDELIYSELGRSFADGGRFLVRDVPTSGYGVVYPILISPAYRLFHRLPEAYAAVKVINSFVMSLAAVPAYLLARRILKELPALLVAVLTVAVPSMAYTGTVMTENVFYGLFLIVTLLFVLMLERPTAGRQVAVLLLVVLAYLTRAQSLAFVPAVVVAPVLLCFFQRRRLRDGLRAYAPLYGIVVAGGAVVVALELARGRSLRGLLGAYAVVSDQSYDVRQIVDFVLWHEADLALYVGVIPLAATLLLVLRARRQTPRVQAFLAATIPLAISFMVVVAAFATRFASDRIHERNLFQLCPLLFVGLLVWAGRPVHRGRVWLLQVALVAAVALSPLTIPYHRFVGDPIRGDTLALLPVWTINRHYLFGSVLATVGVVCCALGALVLVVPRRFALFLPVVVLAWFALLLQPVLLGPRGFEVSSRGAVFQGIQGVPRDWIDRALPGGARVSVLWTGSSDRFTVNQNEFFNSAVGDVFYTGAPTPGGIGETPVRVAANGTVRMSDGRTIDTPYALLDGSVTPDGEVVARDELGTTLWRLHGPLASLTRVTGLYPNDTWSGRTVTWTRLRCTGGRLLVGLHSDPTLFAGQLTRVVASVGGQPVARIIVPPVGAATLRVPLESTGRRCRVRFTVTPTRVPAETIPGNTDDRELGAHFDSFVHLEPK
jgi:hypothetical protein